MNADPDIIPVFQDEVHFQVQTSITRKWAPKGSKPKVMSKPGKSSIAYSGFVIPETGELFVMKPEWFNFKTVIQSFRDFIKAKPVEDGKKYIEDVTIKTIYFGINIKDEDFQLYKGIINKICPEIEVKKMEKALLNENHIDTSDKLT